MDKEPIHHLENWEHKMKEHFTVEHLPSFPCLNWATK